MRTILLGALTAGLLLSTMGCAHNSIIGRGVTRADQYFGNLGITGSGNNVTVLAGSRVPKLSLLGDNCTVTIQDGAFLHRVEFWGKNNVVSIPDAMILRTSEVGYNQIIRRSRETPRSADVAPWSGTPQTAAPAAAQPAHVAPAGSIPPAWQTEQPAEVPEEDVEFKPPPTMESPERG